MLYFIQGLFSNLISLTVFLGLSVLLIIDLGVYGKIFKELSSLNQKIDRGGLNQGVVKRLVVEYKEILGNSLTQVNTRSFIESYFADYKVEIGRRSDLGTEGSFLTFPVVSSLTFIQKSISFFILVGVLGTFIGLYYSLSQLPTTDINLEQFGSVMSGMQIAFNTSIIGMLYSLIVNFVTKLFNAEELLTKIMLKLENHLDNRVYTANLQRNLFTESIDQLQEALTTTYTNSINQLRGVLEDIYQSMNSFENFSAEFEQGREHMNQFNYRLNKSIEKFDIIQQQLKETYQHGKDFNQQFKVGLDDLNNNFASLFKVFDNLQEKQQSYLKLFKEQTEIQNKSNQTLKEELGLLKRLTEKTEDSFKTYTERFSETIGELENAIVEENESQSQLLDDLITKLNDYLAEYSQEFKKQSQYLEQRQDEESKLIMACEKINQTNGKLIYKVNNLAKTLDQSTSAKINKLERIMNNFNQVHSKELKNVLEEFKNYIEITERLIDEKFEDIDTVLGNFLSDIDFNLNDLELAIKDLNTAVYELAENMNQNNQFSSELKELFTTSEEESQENPEENEGEQELEISGDINVLTSQELEEYLKDSQKD
ncbi:MotA/TolQ/ExbB proton channel family protein [Natroniella acetigena]|uniref:MotA/TolQ/ExbB proton channel family protein n=1 Tax=Natroniella acetigena TaxID=52004 RepID=UPI002009DDC8|nr:MotA/TolQ/ExbB proton channel family protein [Natroniella acetigena]MCK8828305.1 MotA/TolQ/ExbB proton channel family protein [Natroniella acetigena]